MIEGNEPTREELLELAQLGALGLLDEIDAARLERGFAAASPALQAEVVDLESRTMKNPALLSDERPPSSLRLRVLARIHDELEADARSAQPLATIGPAPAAGSARRGAASRGDSGDAAATITADSMRELIEDIARRNAAQRGPSQLYWRAASFVLLASLVVSLYFNNRLSDLSRRLADATVARSIEEDAARIAQEFRGFEFVGARHSDLLVAIGPSEGGPKGHVSVYEERGSGRVAVIGIGFNAGEIVRVNILDDEGGVVRSSQYRVAVAGFGGIIDVGSAVIPGMRVEVRDANGGLLFRQA